MLQKHLDLPGSPEWHARRAGCFNAGDAPAMLDCSPHLTRRQLLTELHTGVAREFSSFVQERVIDPGHSIEELCRPLAEDVLGEELQVLSYSLAVAGLSRPLGASLDGVTFMVDTNWECKRLNNELRAALPHSGPDSHQRNSGANLPKDKRVQMEQQMLVNGAKQCLFTAGELGPKGEIIDARHAWYYPDPALRKEVLSGWNQFDADLVSYVPTAPTVEVVGRAPGTLPALHIVINGEVSASNLDEFKQVALSAIRSVNRDLKTDQDFADSAKARKWCEDIESRVKAAKNHALSQTVSIDLLFRTMDEVSEEAARVRLELEKLEKARKDARKGEIVAGGVKGLADHIAALNTRLGKPYMPPVPVDFGAAIRNMRSFDSMQNAVESALAKAKIAASEIADRIDTNLKTLRKQADGLQFLFADTAQIVLKAPDDLAILVKSRVADHHAAEAKKEEERRATIRREEEARATNELQERNRMAMSEIQGIQQQVMIATMGRMGVRKGGTIECIRETLAETEARTIDEQRFGTLFAMAASAKESAVTQIRTLLANAEAQAAEPVTTPAAPQPSTAASLPPPAPAPTVIAMPPRTQPAAHIAPTLSIGAINERLVHFATTEAGLRGLGFEPAGRERSAPRYHESDFAHILAAIVAHVQTIQAKQAA